MAATTWPDDIPKCFLTENYMEEPQPITIRSPVDSGPRKLRRRFTKRVVNVAASIVCNLDEINALEEFFYVTLQGGTQTFEKEHPFNGKTITYRFLEPPVLAGVYTKDQFQIQLLLEELNAA